MRVFLDTSGLISTLATRGLCAELYERLLTEHQVVIGEPLVAEVLDIMRRKFQAGNELLAKVEAELCLLEIVPAQTAAPKLPIKDREDPWIIACALAGTSVVRNSVLHENEQLFASKYRLVLPTEDKLRAELERDRTLLEARREKKTSD